MPNIVSLGVPGGGQMENDLILDGGTLSYVGLTNCNLNNYPVLNPNDATINVASPTNALTFVKTAVGPGSLTKTGPGTLRLSVSSDNYSGGTIVNAGTLALPVAALGTGPLTLNNTVTLVASNNLALTNSVIVAGPATTVLVTGVLPGTNVFSGPWSGGGTATFSITNTTVFSADMSGMTGTMAFDTSTGIVQFNNNTNKNLCVGSAAATFDLGTGSLQLRNFNGGGLTYNLGALIGGPNTVLSGRATNSAAIAGTTYSIGANGVSTTYAGIITNGLDTVNVVKVGSGSLSLNGNSTYSGSTTVSNGILGGTGSIASPLTVVAGGTLAPGAPVGTFTVSNTATLGGSVLLSINK
jgi:autotransporter-associated beta strand protein